MNFLEKEKLPNSQFLFLSPPFSQLLKMSKADECQEFLKPFIVEEKLLIFLPVNDNYGDQARGNHWSLLIYSQNENCFFSFDSRQNFNENATRKLFYNLVTGLR